MNRHARRRATRLSRHVRTGYLHRLSAATPLLSRGQVYHTTVAHDPGCAIYGELAACDCVPEITLRPHGGSEVIVIDADGTARKVRPC
jgi:hypothetical protein